jgi:hypothetical protein
MLATSGRPVGELTDWAAEPSSTAGRARQPSIHRCLAVAGSVLGMVVTSRTGLTHRPLRSTAVATDERTEPAHDVDTPDRPPDWSVWTATGEAAQHWTPVAAVVTAVGYLAGRSSVSSFASALQVGAADLGIEFRDYVLLAALLLPAVPLFFLGLAAGRSVVDPGRKDGAEALILGAIALILIRVVIEEKWRPLSPPWGLAHVAITAGYILGFERFFQIGFFRIIGGRSQLIESSLVPRWKFSLSREGAVIGYGLSSMALQVAVVFLAFSTVSSMNNEVKSWASEIRTAAEAGEDIPDGPAGISWILHPELGTASVGGTTTCAVRIGDKILVGMVGTTVVPQIDRFTSRRCGLDRYPLDS